MTKNTNKSDSQRKDIHCDTNCTDAFPSLFETGKNLLTKFKSLHSDHSVGMKFDNSAFRPYHILSWTVMHLSLILVFETQSY